METKNSEVQKETARLAIEGISETINTFNQNELQNEMFKNLYKLAAMSAVNKIWTSAKDALKLAMKNFVADNETLVGLKINGSDWPIGAYLENPTTPPEHPKILTETDLKQIYTGSGGKQNVANNLF